MKSKLYYSVLILLSIFILMSCDDDTSSNNNTNTNNNNTSVYPVRNDCLIRIEMPAASEISAKLVGTFNEWQISAGYPLVRDGYMWNLDVTSNKYESNAGIILLEPGEYEYKIVFDDTTWMLDSNNPYTIFDKTQQNENSLLVMPNCSIPLIKEGDSVINWDNKTIDMDFQVYRGSDGTAIETITAALYEGEVRSEITFNYDSLTGEVSIFLDNLTPGKYHIVLDATDTAGRTTSLDVPVWMENGQKSWEDMILYSIFVDRFHNGEPANDAPINGLEAQINWQGGDWKGITQKIQSGFFTDLGITALWLSTPMDNPDHALPGDCNREFSGYHAYWPQASREVENHFGTKADLKELVQEAHKKGIRVLVDWAANHVFIDHELHTQYYGNAFWFNYTGSMDPNSFWENKCGVLGWDTHPLTCWFTEYLPDYNHRNQGLLHILIEDALWWVKEFDLDGFRVDATKHIRSNYLKLLRKALDEKSSSKVTPFYMVGENFLYDYGIINEKISEYELQGQFDFPLYGTIRTALMGGVNLSDLNTFVYANFIDNQNITDLDWSKEGPAAHGTLMGNFLGNHDVERFSSVAAGDTNGDGCQAFTQALVPQTDDENIYKSMGVGFAFLLSVRGLPVIYYGDEFGLAGVKDPDNRRLMVFDDLSLSSAQIELKELFALLANLRNSYPALRTGKYDAFHGDPSCLSYLKALGDEKILVVLAGDAGCTTNITMKDGYGLDDGAVLDEVLYAQEQKTIAGGQISVDIPAFGVRFYLLTSK
jgi:neopullulanase